MQYPIVGICKIKLVDLPHILHQSFEKEYYFILHPVLLIKNCMLFLILFTYSFIKRSFNKYCTSIVTHKYHLHCNVLHYIVSMDTEQVACTQVYIKYHVERNVITAATSTATLAITSATLAITSPNNNMEATTNISCKFEFLN